jgi:hypothetical protein
MLFAAYKNSASKAKKSIKQLKISILYKIWLLLLQCFNLQNSLNCCKSIYYSISNQFEAQKQNQTQGNRLFLQPNDKKE